MWDMLVSFVENQLYKYRTGSCKSPFLAKLCCNNKPLLHVSDLQHERIISCSEMMSVWVSFGSSPRAPGWWNGHQLVLWQREETHRILKTSAQWGRSHFHSHFTDQSALLSGPRLQGEETILPSFCQWESVCPLPTESAADWEMN